MPTLNERIKIAPRGLFFFAGLFFTTVLYYSQGSSKQDYAGDLAKLKAEFAKTQETLKFTQERATNKGKFQEDMERVSQTFRLALDYLPKELDTQDLLKKIYSEARAAGVQLADFKPKDSVSKDFYDELPMEIQIKGTYSQIVTFLGNICKVPRIINIRDVHITSPTLVDGYPVLQLNGVLVGYRYKEAK